MYDRPRSQTESCVCYFQGYSAALLTNYYDKLHGLKFEILKTVTIILQILENFVDAFFDANPMSQLGWIGMRNKMAEKLSEMSGNPRKQIEFVKSMRSKYTCGGEPSLQNALEMALSTLKHMPTHTSREVLIIMGSLTTCDPGDITQTIKV